MIALRKRGKYMQVDYATGTHRLRGSLGTTNRDVALRLKNRLENAMAEGPQSGLWTEIAKSMPAETYRRFAAYSGVNRRNSPDWARLKEAFQTHMTQRIQMGKLSPSTRDRYQRTLDSFDKFLKAKEIETLDEITRPVIEAWKSDRLTEILAKKFSRGGGGLVLDTAVLHKIFAIAVEHDMLAKNPVKSEGTPGANPKGGAEPFTGDELKRLRENAGKDLLTFQILRWTGLRGSDTVDLRWSDVHFDRREIERCTQKRKKTVIIPLHKELLQALADLAQTRQPKSADFVLLNPDTGRPMGRPVLYNRIMALGKRAGIARATPHRFRDTLAVDMLIRGATIFDTAKLLGDTVETVQRHYAPFTSELRDRVRGFLDNDTNGLEKTQ